MFVKIISVSLVQHLLMTKMPHSSTQPLFCQMSVVAFVLDLERMPVDTETLPTNINIITILIFFSSSDIEA